MYGENPYPHIYGIKRREDKYMNQELENKALNLIYRLRTYDPTAGDNPRWFTQCLSDLEDVIIDDEISPEERKRLKRIEKRKKLGTNMDNTLYIEDLSDHIRITVSVPKSEIVYLKAATEVDVVSNVLAMCFRYDVKQIFIQDDHWGTDIINLLNREGIGDSIDIVKYKCKEAQV